MKLHGNARTCLHGRRLMVERVLEQGWTLAQAAEAAGVSVRTVSKWLARFRVEGADGLLDRSSAPAVVPARTPEERVELVAALRRLRMTGAEIAETLSMPLSTVSAVLSRIGLGRLCRLEPPEPPNRYERKRPGELLHIDVKKLGRIRGVGHRVTGDRASQRDTRRHGRRLGVAGWEYVHVCVDDATRIAYVEVLDDEKAATAAGFLRRAVAHYRAHGISVERVLTDNGSAYRGVVHALACKTLGIKHLRTRPYRPRTNGKAERFIRTMLGGWAYGAIYGNSDERRAALPGWLHFYNHRRPHGSLSHQPPLQRLEGLMRNNLAGSYT
ncbi:MAG: IS481 family transposase [Gaiellaceae bacterium]